MAIQTTLRPSVQQLHPSLIRQVANGAIGRQDIIPLWFGEPDVPTPEFIREAAKAVGGGGGGRPDLAEAGGKDPTKIEEALQAAREFYQKAIGG